MARGSNLFKQVVSSKVVKKEENDDNAGLNFGQFNEVLEALHFTSSKDNLQLYHFLDFNNSGEISRAEWATLASFNVELDRKSVEKFRKWLMDTYGSYDVAFSKMLEIIRRKQEEKIRLRNTSKRGSTMEGGKVMRGSVMNQNFPGISQFSPQVTKGDD